MSSPPEPGTVERWAFDYVTTTALSHKLEPPPAPARWEDAPPPRRIAAPGRPAELRVVPRAPRSPSRTALVEPRQRAKLLHTFLHHELQAAELMAWALLAFVDTPRAFRRGVAAICRDEIRHAALYRRELVRLGCAFGDFPVRDWFWQRVPTCQSPVEFVALMGMGLEAGNLDHGDRFAAWLSDAGDERAAALIERVGREEIAHVRFATRWFRRWTGGVEFGAWSERIVAPLTPAILRGRELNRSARLRAGFPDAFLDALDALDAHGADAAVR